MTQGESVPSIARRYGVGDWEAIYEHPGNAGLRERRPDPHVLAPGDEVFIPDVERLRFTARVDERNRFEVSRPPLRLRVHVHRDDDEGEPYRQARFQVDAGRKRIDGTTDGDGLVDIALPDGVDEVTLTVWPAVTGGDGGAQDSMPLVWSLQVGHLDPVDSESGMIARLENLGFDCGDPPYDDAAAVEQAIAAFAEAQGIDLASPGSLDAVRDALLAEHGC